MNGKNPPPEVTHSTLASFPGLYKPGNEANSTHSLQPPLSQLGVYSE